MVKWWIRRVFIILVVFVIVMLVSYHLSLTSNKHQLDNEIFEHAGIDDMQVILHVAQRIWNRGKPVLITVLNDAYLPFANSWLCNTIYMDIHDQVLVITTDDRSRDDLARQWPNIHVIALSGEKGLSGIQMFRHAGYTKIMIRRTEIIQELLKNGMEVLLFEVDCVWLSNPIPECQSQIEGYDMIATQVSQRPDLIGGGFLYLRPTDPILILWEKLTEKLSDLLAKVESMNETDLMNEGENDQTYLSRLVMSRYGDVRVKVMPLDIFADGRWYKKSKSERKHLHPVIINNNWVSKNTGKIRRARKFRHWFWKQSGKCDLNLVRSKIH